MYKKNKAVFLLTHMFEHIDGGAGTYAHYLLERLSVNKEFDFYVITPDLKKTRENVIKIRKLETFYKTTINYRLAVDKFSKNYTDIIVHASSCNELIAFKDSGYKLIANVNDYEVCNVYKLLPLYLKIYNFYSLKKIVGKIIANYYERKVLRNSDYVLVNSKYTIEQLKKTYKDYKNNFLCYKAVDIDFFDFNIKDNKKFLFIGKDWRKKGLLPTILGLNDLALIDGYFDLELNIVGLTIVERKIVLGLIKNINLKIKIKFYVNANRIEVKKLLDSCNYFILPSYIESFGISFLEAMASGTIVIGSGTGGIQELIKDRENGFILGDISRLCITDLVRKIFNYRDDEINKIRLHGLETAKKFDLDNMINNLKKFYL